MRFEWNRAKAETNLRKHRVSFEVARLAFYDPFALMEQDRIEDGELRWQAIGLAANELLLLVAYTTYDDADGSEVVRIISARRADKTERRRYEEQAR